MLDPGSNRELPPIPAKRYFTIGEVSELCDVKPHVLRYWETEFPSLKPVKRRGNRRYYQRHDVLMVRQIRGLLYEQGYTIGGARLRLEGDVRQGRIGAEQPDHQAGADGAGRSAAAAAALSLCPCDPCLAAGMKRLQYRYNRFRSRGVAQPGSASAWGAEGRRFKSGRPDQSRKQTNARHAGRFASRARSLYRERGNAARPWSARIPSHVRKRGHRAFDLPRPGEHGCA